MAQQAQQAAAAADAATVQVFDDLIADITVELNALQASRDNASDERTAAQAALVQARVDRTAARNALRGDDGTATESLQSTYDLSRSDADDALTDFNAACTLLAGFDKELRDVQTRLREARTGKAQAQAVIAHRLASQITRATPPPPPAPNPAAPPAAPLPAAPAAGANTATYKDVYINTKIAQRVASTHQWSDACSPLVTFRTILESVQSEHRLLPITYGSYYAMCHDDKLDTNLAPSKVDVHLAHFIAEYQRNHAEWHRHNDNSQSINDAVNAFGTESWTIDGKLLTVGKIFYNEICLEIARVEGGISNGYNAAGNQVLTIQPALPHHVAGNASCTSASHVDLNNYCSIDQVIAGLLLQTITPPKGSAITKPAFWTDCDLIYRSPNTEGSRTVRMLRRIIAAQPTSHSIIARSRADHWKQPFIDGCSLHVYADLVFVRHAEFQKEHGVHKPFGFTDWDEWIWYQLVHTIEQNFKPEHAQFKGEYYRMISDIAKALIAAKQPDGTYDFTAITSMSDDIRQHISPTHGYQLAMKLITSYYTVASQDGSWTAKSPPASWQLPSYDDNRFAGTHVKPARVLVAREDEASDFDDDEDFSIHVARERDAPDPDTRADMLFALSAFDADDPADVTRESLHHLAADMADNDLFDDDQLSVLRSAADLPDDDESFGLYMQTILNAHPQTRHVSSERKARVFAMFNPSKAGDSGPQQRRSIKQQQQQGSYFNPRSHTPSHGRGGSGDFAKAGFKGKGGSFNSGKDRKTVSFASKFTSRFGAKKSDTAANSSVRGIERDDKPALAKRIDRIRGTESGKQRPFVRDPPQPSTQPGRQMFDRIRKALAVLKHAESTGKPVTNSELSGVIRDLSIYTARSEESTGGSSRGSALIADKLFQLRDDAASMSDAELEEAMFRLRADGDADFTDDEYENYALREVNQTITTVGEDGELFQLHITRVSPTHSIVDTGGSRDIFQNKDRFVPGSLVKLKFPVAIHMAKAAIYGTHIGVVRYAVKAHPDHVCSHADDGTVAFTWLQLGLWVPDCEKDLAIFSVPSAKKLGISLRAEGDLADNDSTSVRMPYLYPAGQSVYGIAGATMPSLAENGTSFRGVETTTVPNSNMMMLEMIPESELGSYTQIDLLSGLPFNHPKALAALKLKLKRHKTFPASHMLGTSLCAARAVDAAADQCTMDHLSLTGQFPKTETGQFPPPFPDKTEPGKAGLEENGSSCYNYSNDQLRGSSRGQRYATQRSASLRLPDHPSLADGSRHCSPAIPLANYADPSSTTNDANVGINDADVHVDVDATGTPSGHSRMRSWLTAFAARARAPFRKCVPDRPPTNTAHYDSAAGHKSGQSSAKSTAKSRTRWPHMSYKLKVLLLCSGMASLMFGGWHNLRTQVVGLCESNASFYPYYKKHCPNAPIYPDMCALDDGLRDGTIPYFHCDAIEAGCPCQGRTSLRWHNNRQDDPLLDRDLGLYLRIPSICDSLRPSYVVCEMTREHEFSSRDDSNRTDYDKLVIMMKARGYVPHVYSKLNSYDCGDATSRDRDFRIFIHSSVPKSNNFDLDGYCPGFGRPMTPHLDKPSEIPAHLWVSDRFITREGGELVVSSDRSRVRFTAFPVLRALTSSTRSLYRTFTDFTEKYRDRYITHAILLGNIFTTSMLGGKVYSRHGPYVTITREARGMLYDDRDEVYSGVRYPSLNELARFSGFVGPQRAFLHSLPTEKEALLMVAGAITHGTTKCVWSAICDHAFGAFEKNYFLKSTKLTPVVDAYTHCDDEDYVDTDFKVAMLSRSENDARVREPMHNWTSREINQGWFDSSIALNDRVKTLNSEGYEYSDDLYLDYRDRPSRREQIDSIKRTPYGNSPTDDSCVRVWRRADGTEIVEKGSWIQLPVTSPIPGTDVHGAWCPQQTLHNGPTERPNRDGDVARKEAQQRNIVPDDRHTIPVASSEKLPYSADTSFPLSKDLGLSKKPSRTHVPTTDFAPLPAANTPAGLERCREAWKLHNTLCPCSAETFENTIAITAGTKCRQGDSRIVANCPRCVRFNFDAWRAGQHSKSNTRFFKRFKPGEGVSIDGADARTVSKFGNYSIVLIAIDMATMKTYSMFLRNNSSREFVEAMDNLRKQLHLETGNRLRHVTSDAFSTYMEHVSTADWRDIHSIELVANPGHAKQWNAYAENRIRTVKRKCRAALDNLKGKEVSGSIITDPTPYWPLAWVHSLQSLNMCTHSTLEEWHGMPMSPDQAASGDFTPRTNRLLPFGSVGYMHLEKGERDGPLLPTNERCYYCFNGQSNLLVNKFVHMPRAHVVLTADRGSIIATGKVVWTPDTELDRLARDSQRHLPGGNPLHSDDSSTPSALDAPTAATASPALAAPMPTADPFQPSNSDNADNAAPDVSADPAQPVAPVQPVAPAAIATPPAPGLADNGNADARAHDNNPNVGCDHPGHSPRTGNANDDSAQELRRSPRTQSRVAPAHAASPADRAPDVQPTAAPAANYIGRRVLIPDGNAIISGTVLAKGTEVGTGRTLWNVRRSTGASEDFYTEELVPLLVDDTPAAPTVDSPIDAPDVLPSLSQLYKRDDVAIKLLKPNAKQSKRNGSPSKSFVRWEKYKHAKTVGEYKQLGGTSADFINDFAPQRRYFTFADPELERQHLRWLDDGGDVPVFFVHKAVEKAFARTLNHPAVMEAILRSPSNVTSVEGANKLKYFAYRATEFHEPDPDKLRDGIPDNSDLYDTLMWHAVRMRNADIEFNFLTKDDIVIDKSKLACLRDIPVEQIPAFVDAIVKELSGLIALGTWKVDILPDDREAIGTKLVLKAKYKADGTFDKNKARLVVQGFHQRIGKDFYSTFSPMASLTAVRMLMATAVQLGLPLIHMDVPQAFIQAMVDADIYVKLPKGISILTLDEAGKRVPLEDAGKALKLIKALYGLKQAPQLWNKELTNYLSQLGFKRLESESSIYLKRNDAQYTVILAEVDDLVITGSSVKDLDTLKKSFVDKWQITDWEPIKSFLGIRVNYDLDAGLLTMDVEHKVNDFFAQHAKALGKVGSSNIPYVETAVKEAHTHPDRALSPLEQYMHDNFASIVGSLIYISITCRPDIVYAVNQMAKGMHNPKLAHIVAMKQTLKYLNSHRGLSLTYRRKHNLIEGLFRTLAEMDGALQTLQSTAGTPGDPAVLFSDSDYANDPETRKSISGKATYLFNCLVSWQSKRQPVIACSTHEAEIIAMKLVADEGIWQRRLLSELGILTSSTIMGSKGRLPPTPLLSDNKASTFTANTPSTGVLSKHIDVRFLKVREYVASGEIRVVHVRTDYNVSDFFTKGLTIQKFARFRELLMGEQPSKSKTAVDTRSKQPVTDNRKVAGTFDKNKTRLVVPGFMAAGG